MATSSPAPRFVACTLILEVRRGGCGKQVHAGADGGCLAGMEVRRGRRQGIGALAVDVMNVGELAFSSRLQPAAPALDDSR